MKISQFCAANYHYKRYTLDHSLDSANCLRFQSVELWASGSHLYLEDFDGERLRELNRTIKDHHLKIAYFTPEQCVYPISVSHPDKRYCDRTVDFFQRHIEAAACLDYSCMVVSTGFVYLDVDGEDALKWTADPFFQICRKTESEGVILALELFTKYTTHICNEASQLLRLLRTVGGPVPKGLGGMDVIATTGMDTSETFIGILGRESLAYVHFVDGNPGGHLVPGDGNLNSDQALHTLEAFDHKGCLGLEILDRRYVTNPEDAMRRAPARCSERIG